MNNNIYQPKDPNYQQKVTASFNRQVVMQTLKVSLADIQPGTIKLTMPFQESLTQQHGFLHAGIVSTVLDSACGYAAFSLMPADAAVLSIEFKVNLLAPAKGERFEAVAEVVKPGRTITVVEGRLFVLTGEERKLVATMNGTMMAVYGRAGVQQ